jgi:hypothetical protein
MSRSVGIVVKKLKCERSKSYRVAAYSLVALAIALLFLLSTKSIGGKESIVVAEPTVAIYLTLTSALYRGSTNPVPRLLTR